MENKWKTLTIVLTVAVLILSIFFVNNIVQSNKRFEVSFDSDGGSEIESQLIKKDAFAFRPEDPQKDGFVFSHWQVEGEEFDFSTPVTEDLSLKAVYTEATGETSDIALIFDDGFSAINEVRVVEGRLLLPEDPVREGYEFVRWESDGIEFDFDGPLADGMKVYAVWKEIPTEHVVDFFSGGGSKIPRQKILEGETVREPDAPTRKGYTFLGWFLDGKEYDFSQAVTESFTLMAEWEEGPKTVDKSALMSAVSSANQNLSSTSTSTNGSDVYTNNMWVTSAVKSAYADAIAKAQAVVDDTDATQEEVDAAVAALNEAASAFNGAKRNGTRALPVTTTTPTTKGTTQTTKKPVETTPTTTTTTTVVADKYTISIVPENLGILDFIYVYKNNAQINAYAVLDATGVELGRNNEGVITVNKNYSHLISQVQLTPGGPLFSVSK
ncbi:MAG: InlB B-repeat-containing protein [Eubacteriales bacterium]|nr:InlB B-repeat-containing protein [Eubacteriales bacterium]MDD4323971.1 InlB B-repeat-containing protein [Eubacteriales bacterium]MDD4541584.1 InlB B-repeat-containing protein [Eubacteriales bacterium]